MLFNKYVKQIKIIVLSLLQLQTFGQMIKIMWMGRGGGGEEKGGEIKALF